MAPEAMVAKPAKVLTKSSGHDYVVKAVTEGKQTTQRWSEYYSCCVGLHAETWKSHQKVKLLPYSSMQQNVKALNSQLISCPDFGLVFSNSKNSYYLLWPEDRDAEATEFIKSPQEDPKLEVHMTPPFFKTVGGKSRGSSGASESTMDSTPERLRNESAASPTHSVPAYAARARNLPGASAVQKPEGPASPLARNGPASPRARKVNIEGVDSNGVENVTSDAAALLEGALAEQNPDTSACKNLAAQFFEMMSGSDSAPTDSPRASARQHAKRVTINERARSVSQSKEKQRLPSCKDVSMAASKGQTRASSCTVTSRAQLGDANPDCKTHPFTINTLQMTRGTSGRVFGSGVGTTGLLASKSDASVVSKADAPRDSSVDESVRSSIKEKGQQCWRAYLSRALSSEENKNCRSSPREHRLEVRVSRTVSDARQALQCHKPAAEDSHKPAIADATRDTAAPMTIRARRIPMDGITALTVEEFTLDTLAFDPTQAQAQRKLLKSLNLPPSVSIEEALDAHGAFNDGVWLVNDDETTGLVLKLVPHQRKPEWRSNRQTDTEKYVALQKMCPNIGAQWSFSFPVKIFQLKNCSGRRCGDLIVMRRALGWQITQHLFHKFPSTVGQAELLVIFKKFGVFMATLHSFFKVGNKSMQHGDCQPSNVFYDALTDKFTLIDCADFGFGPYLAEGGENDVEHFIAGLKTLTQFYTGAFIKDCETQFRTGYKEEGSRRRFR